eukprot:6206364-Pleurochrysis_carterae.AAC.4
MKSTYTRDAPPHANLRSDCPPAHKLRRSKRTARLRRGPHAVQAHARARASRARARTLALARALARALANLVAALRLPLRLGLQLPLRLGLWLLRRLVAHCLVRA